MLHLILLLFSSLIIHLGSRADQFLMKTKQGSHFIATAKNSFNPRPPDSHQSKSASDYADVVGGPITLGCPKNQSGEKKQEDTPGEVGWVLMRCPQGCLTIHKVRYACDRGEGDEVQLGIVQERCQGKESCFLRPGKKLFYKNVACPKKDHPLMWLVYSCDGGKDETKTFAPPNLKCQKSFKCNKESICKEQAGICR